MIPQEEEVSLKKSNFSVAIYFTHFFIVQPEKGTAVILSDAIKDKVKKKKPSVVIDDKPKEEAEKVVDSNG